MISASYPLQGVSAGGQFRLALPSRAIGVEWLIGQITVGSTGVAQTLAQIVLNNQVFASTSSGLGDTCSGDPPVLLRPADSLEVIWANTNAGDVLTATIWYQTVGKS